MAWQCMCLCDLDASLGVRRTRGSSLASTARSRTLNRVLAFLVAMPNERVMSCTSHLGSCRRFSFSEVNHHLLGVGPRIQRNVVCWCMAVMDTAEALQVANVRLSCSASDDVSGLCWCTYRYLMCVDGGVRLIARATPRGVHRSKTGSGGAGCHAAREGKAPKAQNTRVRMCPVELWCTVALACAVALFVSMTAVRP